MSEIKKQKPTYENLNVYESLMKTARECDNGNYDEQLTRLNEAQAYYDQFDWFCETFEENGKVGLKDALGRVVVEAKYDDILYSPAYDYMASVPVKAEKDGKFGIIRLFKDGSAKEITEFEYEDTYVIEFSPYTAVRKAGSDKWGLIDFDGKMVIPAEMDSIFNSCANGNIFVSKEGKTGVYDYVYDGFAYPEYDSIDGMGDGGLLVFIKDGVEGHVDVNGKFYSLATLDRFYEGEKYDVDGTLIFDGAEDDEPLLLADHLD